MIDLIDKLYITSNLTKSELSYLLENIDDKSKKYLIDKALDKRTEYYQNKVYPRGLIEFTNYCKNNCYYCGIRRDNKNADRYRLTKEEILEACEIGYNLGLRSFVLQGGEDPFFTDDRMVEIILSIKTKYPDCALTLSIGEKSYASYKRFYDAGADRYLLRHETATDEHYSKLHPQEMSLEYRKQCLKKLKEIGFQIGAGFMVGSPFQTIENIAEDLIFLKELSPEMVGIGPFIPQKDTPFADYSAGTAELTTTILAIVRLLLPTALIPSTTALGTIHSKGREQGLLAGANVVMPNLSPISVRSKYSLYDNKICTGDEAAECIKCLANRIKSVGFELEFTRGDHYNWQDERNGIK